ncbi:HinfI family type II restriction enzyme [uncultured Chloroflexus sp.]|uniref:HinfI family type II restriction enzyme n=1 Tax=uncultured Chloroflexus sp. TaxID=214040 RepID=UPI00262D4D26|nr:hypothetical protein [uncultured Chloroflexus sp.]
MNNIKDSVKDAITEIINYTFSEETVNRVRQVHEAKIHFVPTRYRILGGLLQSLNIKFGNFIERLIALVIKRDPKVEFLPLSGKRAKLSMSAETDALIDRYITSRQLPESPNQCDKLFEDLLRNIIHLERNTKGNKQAITKDIDALFKLASGQVVYLEIKYNDDHDTGKFVDINRKLIKTYAGLVNALEIKDVESLKPILYYFNPVKRWEPIYIPSSNIYRGSELFDAFFETRFQDIENYLRQLEDEEEVISIFDDLYCRIRYRT